MMMLVGCTPVNIPEAANSKFVTAQNLKADINVRDVTLSWDALPENVDKTLIYRNGQLIIDSAATINSMLFKHQDPNTDIIFTVKCVKGQMVSNGVSVKINIPWDVTTTKVLYVLAEGTESEQEKLARAWFEAEYGEAGGKTIAAVDLKNINVDEFSTLWFNLDRKADQADVLPASWQSEETISLLKQFCLQGGKIYASKQATLMLPLIGRTGTVDINLYEAEDAKACDAVSLNAKFHKKYDQTTHPIFAGLQKEGNYFPIAAAATREDHVCTWKLSEAGLTGLLDFQDNTNSLILAADSKESDIVNAGIVEFYPYNAYTGPIIANGMGAYYWSSDAQAANMKLLTRNIIEYIRKYETK